MNGIRKWIRDPEVIMIRNTPTGPITSHHNQPHSNSSILRQPDHQTNETRWTSFPSSSESTCRVKFRCKPHSREPQAREPEGAAQVPPPLFCLGFDQITVCVSLSLVSVLVMLRSSVQWLSFLDGHAEQPVWLCNGHGAAWRQLLLSLSPGRCCFWSSFLSSPFCSCRLVFSLSVLYIIIPMPG